jgi:hypothetical protein
MKIPFFFDKHSENNSLTSIIIVSSLNNKQEKNEWRLDRCG